MLDDLIDDDFKTEKIERVEFKEKPSFLSEQEQIKILKSNNEVLQKRIEKYRLMYMGVFDRYTLEKKIRTIRLENDYDEFTRGLVSGLELAISKVEKTEYNLKKGE